jgi:spermidine dehydrogenase
MSDKTEGKGQQIKSAKRHITRRDYLNGMAVFAVGFATGAVTMRSGFPESDMPVEAPLTEAMLETSPTLPSDYYPPTLTGMRGSHVGSFETAHSLAWRGERPAEFADLDEEYDMVVVGAGISGIAAAYLYQQQAGKDKRILLLDNHDDFGGHAKRNEFHYQGHMILGAGGSGYFGSPSSYAPETKKIIKDAGFDTDELKNSTEPNYYGSPIGLYMPGRDSDSESMVHGDWMHAWHGYGDYRGLVKKLPFSDSEKEKLLGFIEGSRSLEKELPSEDLKTTVRSISYKTFLTDYVGLKEETCAWNSIFDLYYLAGFDCISLSEAISVGLPGAKVLSQDVLGALELGLSEEEQQQGASDKDGITDQAWMPDGNASFCRQIVRLMIPGVASGKTVESLFAARFDYSQLDRADHPVRLRLNSTVVNVANNPDRSVSVSYVQQGKSYRLKTKRCILACYNGLIASMCPELPQEQKDNLLYGVRGPMLAVNVLLRNGHAFYQDESQIYQCPTSPFALVTKAPPVAMGGYKVTSDPKDPMVIYMLGAPAAGIPNDGSLTTRDIYRMGRRDVYSRSFESYEEDIRTQLTGMFGPNGFDADRDIEAITLNRWAHGYAYNRFELFDPAWPEGGAPYELGRKQIGRISIANSDSEARSNLDGAIIAAWRAVQEQLS